MVNHVTPEFSTPRCMGLVGCAVPVVFDQEDVFASIVVRAAISHAIDIAAGRGD